MLKIATEPGRTPTVANSPRYSTLMYIEYVSKYDYMYIWYLDICMDVHMHIRLNHVHKYAL